MKNIEEFWHRCELKEQKFGAQLQTVYFFLHRATVAVTDRAMAF